MDIHFSYNTPLVAKELIFAIDAVLPTGWGSKGHERLQAVIFVEELSDILAESLPDLWKLGNEYLSGSLFHKVGGKNWTPFCGKNWTPFCGKNWTPFCGKNWTPFCGKN